MTDETDPAYGARGRDGVLAVERPATEWLSTGWNGGRVTADAAFVISVPEAWERTELTGYAADRLDSAGFDGSSAGPLLFTGVGIEDARGARYGPVTAYATAGISNPAALPMDPGEEDRAADNRGDRGLADVDRSTAARSDRSAETDHDPTRGTVNVVVGTTRSLAAGALANLLTVAAEAKAATLLAETGFPGTTTDAIIVGHDPTGPQTPFSGSATAVGSATRACVREAVRASLRAHYADSDDAVPESIADATYGISTDDRAAVFRPPIDGRE